MYIPTARYGEFRFVFSFFFLELKWKPPTARLSQTKKKSFGMQLQVDGTTATLCIISGQVMVCY